MTISDTHGPAPFGGDGGLGFSSPLYWLYEMTHAALNPSRAIADATRLYFNNPANPFSQTTIGKSVAAACELFESGILVLKPSSAEAPSV